MLSNLGALLLLVALGVVARVVRRSRLWSDAARSLWRRRRVAVCVIGVYFAVALLDSVAWKGGVPEGTLGVLPNAPHSVIDRIFLDSVESSYSAPFAEVEFYGGRPLRHPGSHPLGTDIIGRDVLHLALKGARVALLIGGLTSLIAIPLDYPYGDYPLQSQGTMYAQASQPGYAPYQASYAPQADFSDYGSDYGGYPPPSSHVAYAGHAPPSQGMQAAFAPDFSSAMADPPTADLPPSGDGSETTQQFGVSADLKQLANLDDVEQTVDIDHVSGAQLPPFLGPSKKA